MEESEDPKTIDKSSDSVGLSLRRNKAPAATDEDERVVSSTECVDEYKGYDASQLDEKNYWFKRRLPLIGDIRFNPVVTTISIILIWSFVAWCMIERENVPFNLWKSWIVQNFTWLYIGSQDVWALFAVYLYFSKYANIKLGKPNDVPEYSDSTWFMMLFACGIGVGLFFFGVAEPVYHYIGPNRYQADPSLPDNTLAQIALNVTLYHWGIHGWIVYSLVGLLLALMAFREGLPLTMKSCFYPLIGDQIYGWVGDLIDIISVITTLFGVCTSLGLGTRQLNTGFHILNPDIPDDNVPIQVITIWCVTAIATASTVSGVGMGIRRLSEICFIIGLFVMMVVLFLDDTFYILNLFVQSIGFYFQWLLQLGFHCDAFEMLGPSHGADDRGRFIPEPFHNEDGNYGDGPSNWMNSWTMFYWGWWISWCPFVGMFIAKISKGRTIRQFINGTMTAPILYSFVWFVIFGGIGIKMERNAAHINLCCRSNVDEAWFRDISAFTKAMDNNIIIKSELVSNSSLSWMCGDATECGACASEVILARISANVTYQSFLSEYETLREDMGSSSLDRKNARLSCHSTEQMWFDVMRSYGSLGMFLSVFSIASIILYFVTSSDSGSLVIDCLTANGDPDPPVIQRVFWAITEGATATALITVGGKKGLQALQAAGIVSGLPFTVLVCLICVSIWRAVKVAMNELDPNGPAFTIGLLDPLGARAYKEHLKDKRHSASKLFPRCLLQIIIAPYTGARCAARVSNSTNKLYWLFYFVPLVLFLLLFILLLILDILTVIPGASAIGWFFVIAFASVLAMIRSKLRSIRGINGNIVEDFFACLFLYPNSVLQMEVTLDEPIINSPDVKSSQTLSSSQEDTRGKQNTGFVGGGDAFI